MVGTKVLVTLGPASGSSSMIQRLLVAGAGAFRINMSHGDQEQWRGFIDRVRKLAPHAPIVMDTQGPEIRLRGVKEDFLLSPGDEFLFSLKKSRALPYLSLPLRVRKGMQVLFDDGSVTTEVVRVRKGVVCVRALDGGLLGVDRKVTVPGVRTAFPVFSAKDKRDLRFCREMGVDAVAVSFCRGKRDVLAARRLLGDGVMVFAKIESSEGVDAVDELVASADGVMVARGDLGVELSFADVPLLQKRIIRLCNAVAKPVIVATQMLESMVVNPRPTRAEASDVANAVLDGADCLMLSGETAIGQYPVESVEAMVSVVRRVDVEVLGVVLEFGSGVGVAEAVSASVVDLSEVLGVDVILTPTVSGFTARMVSRHRPHVPVVAVTHEVRVLRQLVFSWGVVPCLFVRGGGRTVVRAVRSALRAGLLQESDMVVASAGVDAGHAGTTNVIEVHRVSDVLSAR